MTKKEIIADLKLTFGRSFITTNELAKYARISRDKSKEMLSHLDYIPQGKAKTYFVGDVAACLHKRSVPSRMID